MDRIPIVVKVWAGGEPHDFEYIARSLPSLLRSDLPAGCEVLIFNDRSTDIRLAPFLEHLERTDRRVRVFLNEENLGPNLGQERAFEIVAREYADSPYLVTVDDDVIYSRDWLRALLESAGDLRAAGITGIFSALNMPYRPSFLTMRGCRREYLLKWKQPALNWLVPREVYRRVGPFRDEGIAFDTVYSHWLRLHGLPVICLKPSLVQNIGHFGAYAVDDTTTALDFIGEDSHGARRARLLHAVRFHLRRCPAHLKRFLDRTPRRLWPVRWGAEWVDEAEDARGEPCCVFGVDDAIRLGWSAGEVEARVEAVRRADPGGPFAVRRVHRSSRGQPVWVECDWWMLPTIREQRRLPETRAPDPRAILVAVLRGLSPLHARGVAHNKVRQENVYVDAGRGVTALAWLGVEPPPCKPIPVEGSPAVELFGAALDRRARPALRERAAARFLEAIAPEVLAGEAPTPAADVFSAAAVAVLAASPECATLEDMARRRAEWACGRFGAAAASLAPELLARCLTADPAQRFRNAAVALAALGGDGGASASGAGVQPELAASARVPR